MKNFWNDLKKSFSEDINFRLLLGLQFALIPTVSVIFGILLHYLVLRVTLTTLMSFENIRSFVVEDIFVLFIEESIVEIMPHFFLLFCTLIIVGVLLGRIVLRPFKLIGDYCEAKLDGKEISYDPEFLANLKLLSSFTDWFFNSINIMVETGKIIDIKIPEKYKRIHQPVFESSFYLYNLSIILITSTLTALLIFYTNLQIYSGVLDVITEFYASKPEIKTFIYNLQDIFSLISILTIVFNIFTYLMFFYYLYGKISIPAFGIFATMRSFISGRYSSRVHLIGYPYVRNHTRTLNKYLDELEKNYIAKDN